MENRINDNILSITDKTPYMLMMGVVERVKQRRLEKKWTQKMLATEVGISTGSYRRFESSGKISMRSLITLAFVLEINDELENLLSGKIDQSIDDIINAKQSEQQK